MDESRILEAGANCWRIERAQRVRMLVDGEDYFRAFRSAALKARRSLLIVAWDIDSRFELVRGAVDDELPVSLGAFLDSLATRNEDLEIHVLEWDFAMIYATDREWLPRLNMDRARHERVHFHLDDRYPPGSSHHQKIVVVDDRLAFCGGLDLTFGRWDSREHRADDPRRSDNGAPVPQPYHDVQLMLDGDAAAALGELARGRWRAATGIDIPAPRLPGGHDPWPEDFGHDLDDIDVAIARTVPAHGDEPQVREVEQLLLDAIAAARETIYIENQYFTANRVGDALEARLGEEQGPEVVVVLPEQTVGWLSRLTMDVLRERLIRRLEAADDHRRLRVYYPHVPGLGDTCINVHSKVLVVDDTLFRAGSANLNNRSMCLDTECDLAFEASGEREPEVRRAIASLRNRLLAEHLDVEAQALERALDHGQSLIEAIESLRGGERSLVPLEMSVSPELDALVPDSEIADPETPIDGEQLARQFIDEDDKPLTRQALLTLAGFLLVVLAIAACWRWTPLQAWIDGNELIARLSLLEGSAAALLVIPAIYVLAGLIVFPVTLLIAATGMAFGAGYGFVYALLGVELSAIVGYAVGRFLGPDAAHRLARRFVERIDQRIARQGLLAIITLRVVPLAPFSVINMLAGAARMRLRDFALGTLLGITPGVFALTLLSDQLVRAIRNPGMGGIALLAVLATLIVAGSWALGRWLLGREKQQSGHE